MATVGYFLPSPLLLGSPVARSPGTRASLKSYQRTIRVSEKNLNLGKSSLAAIRGQQAPSMLQSLAATTSLNILLAL